MDTATIQHDFDRIAQLPQADWDHNSHYHAFLLKHLPPHLGTALDIGCGTGAFTRLLALRCEQVLGLDLSPEMIRAAQARSQTIANIEFQVADVLTYPLPANHFDCIASIATFHHLPLAQAFTQVKSALKPGGVFLLLDLYQEDGTPQDLLRNVVALPYSRVLRLARTGRARPNAQALAAWASHGAHDDYTRWSEIKRVAAAQLPGAQLQQHLLWRYSLIWRKP